MRAADNLICGVPGRSQRRHNVVRELRKLSACTVHTSLLDACFTVGGGDHRFTKGRDWMFCQLRGNAQPNRATGEAYLAYRFRSALFGKLPVSFTQVESDF